MLTLSDRADRCLKPGSAPVARPPGGGYPDASSVTRPVPVIRSPLLLLAVLAAACGEATAPSEPGPLRPGDGLLDHLSRARLEDLPPGNLPPDVAAVLAPRLPMRTLPIGPREWIHGRPLPPAERAHLRGFEPDPDAGPVRLFKTRPPIRLAEGAPSPRIVRDGEELRLWDPASDEPFPGEMLWWLPAGRTLHAIAQRVPARVRLEYQADAQAELGPFEPWTARRLAGDEAPAPTLKELVRRHEVGDVSRPCLLLPAPASVRVPLRSLSADALDVSLAVADVCWRAVDGWLEEATGRGDGVTFVVEVEDGSGPAERVLERHVPPGAPWVDVRVDLTRWRGRDVVLRLASGPGPDGAADFDYALWGGLRLRGGARRAPERPHVVLLDIDTLRGDRLGMYGYTRHPTSPRLDAWAAREAVVFEDATATASWTLPSTASILTGMAVHQHQVHAITRRITPATPPAALLLSEGAGYETHAVTEGGYVRTRYGFDLGFDRYETAPHHEPDWDPVLEWVATRGSERPFFLFLHTYMVHAPYPHDPRFESDEDPYDGWLAGRDIDYETVIEPLREGELELEAPERAYMSRMYDARIAAMDEMLADFIARLDAVLGDEPYLLVLTSDHGEAFFEHGLVVHGRGLYHEVLSVPLVVRFPDARPSRSRAPVSTLDVLPTILDVAGMAVPDHLPGRSLRDVVREVDPRVSQHSDEAHAIQLGPDKLIVGRSYPGQPDDELVQLFDRHADPGEQRDLSEAEPERVRRLRDLLDEYLRKYPPVEPAPGGEEPAGGLDAAELRELGYMGGGGG